MATLSAQDDTLIDNLTAWLGGFIGRRFPEPLPAEFDVMIREVATDAFLDGAAWADNSLAAAREVLTGGH